MMLTIINNWKQIIPANFSNIETITGKTKNIIKLNFLLSMNLI